MILCDVMHFVSSNFKTFEFKPSTQVFDAELGDFFFGRSKKRFLVGALYPLLSFCPFNLWLCVFAHWVIAGSGDRNSRWGRPGRTSTIALAALREGSGCRNGARE